MRWVLAVLLLLAPAARAETIVAGLSHASVAITADFTGEEILVYGAVRREAPVPEGALDVVITVQGPAAPVIVRRKERQLGIWANAESVRIDRAPTFYAIASTGALAGILSETENLRHQIAIPKAIRAVGISAETDDSPAFLDALIRIRAAEGRYALAETGVVLTAETLFRADVRLPSNLTEGDYRVRMFLLRAGRVVDWQEQVIPVEKAGFERWIANLSRDAPLVYGVLSLVMAVVAGWGAAAAFRLIRP
ncbi:MAG TPA: TIGR02186 family protein [Paracoccaceae bacterium]|nr:TIGR02186 family protein [Paracoccaceae bacterium]HMO72399.1 TIGR02186 family protein [Paracoccaceae bacterium]